MTNIHRVNSVMEQIIAFIEDDTQCFLRSMKEWREVVEIMKDRRYRENLADFILEMVKVYLQSKDT